MGLSKCVTIKEDNYGCFPYTRKGQTVEAGVKRFTWQNYNGMTVQVITYGATITSILVPDRKGTFSDVALGFNSIKGYLNSTNPYFGATVGRVANRIGNARYKINGREYKVTANNPPNQLHGGHQGFDKVLWDSYIKDESKVVMSYLSEDGEEGHPGDVLVNVTFELTEDNEFLIDFVGTTTKPTCVNLTNHSYFNLAGQDGGAEELYNHEFTINGGNILEVNSTYVPTGKLLPVADTYFDFRTPRILGDVINKDPGVHGYDDNYCINKGTEQGNAFVARVRHPHSGRVLEMYSNQPGVQFYTSNFFPEDPRIYRCYDAGHEDIFGKSGNYYKHGAFALETQNYPDAINHENFPDSVLYPGEIYRHSVKYKFLVSYAPHVCRCKSADNKSV